MREKIHEIADELNLSVEAVLIIARSLGIRWAKDGDSYLHPQTAWRIVEFIRTGKDHQPIFLKKTEEPAKTNKPANKSDGSAKRGVVWNKETEKQIRHLVNSDRAVPSLLVKVAPNGFVLKLREERRKRLEKMAAAKKKKLSEISRREQLAEELGIKPTDAMFRKLPGSYESGKK